MPFETKNRQDKRKSKLASGEPVSMIENPMILVRENDKPATNAQPGDKKNLRLDVQNHD